MKLLSVLLIIFGLLWISLGNYYFWKKNDSEKLAFNNYPVESVSSQINLEPQVNKSLPVQIAIADLNINLPVIPAKIDSNNLETTTLGASYLVSSPIPGETGNSIIYGHNWLTLFGKLVNARPGQDIKITYDDGSEKKFTIESTSTVYPTASNVLAPTDDQRITLYTCTGFLDSKRFVAVALLDKNPSFADIRR